MKYHLIAASKSSQQPHAYDCKYKEPGNPSPPVEAFSRFCPSEAIGEPDFTKAGYNQNYPIHKRIQTCCLRAASNSRRLLPRQCKVRDFSDSQKKKSHRIVNNVAKCNSLLTWRELHDMACVVARRQNPTYKRALR